MNQLSFTNSTIIIFTINFIRNFILNTLNIIIFLTSENLKLYNFNYFIKFRLEEYI